MARLGFVILATCMQDYGGLGPLQRQHLTQNPFLAELATSIAETLTQYSGGGEQHLQEVHAPLQLLAMLFRRCTHALLCLALPESEIAVSAASTPAEGLCTPAAAGHTVEKASAQILIAFPQVKLTQCQTGFILDWLKQCMNACRPNLQELYGLKQGHDCSHCCQRKCVSACRADSQDPYGLNQGHHSSQTSYRKGLNACRADLQDPYGLNQGHHSSQNPYREKGDDSISPGIVTPVSVAAIAQMCKPDFITDVVSP